MGNRHGNRRVPRVPAMAVPYTGRLPTALVTMAKPNYSFEKRQRELAKQKKKDEKEAKKRAGREAAKADTPPSGDAADASVDPQ